jgi:hypothetical protein
MNSAGGIFVGMTIMVLLLKPHVSDGVRNALPDPVPTATASTAIFTNTNRPNDVPVVPVAPVQPSTNTETNNEQVSNRMLMLLEGILDKLEKQNNVEPQAKGPNVELSNRLAVQEIQESVVRYNGEDPIVRNRMNLSPRVSSETVTVQEFDRQFNARFGQ